MRRALAALLAALLAMPMAAPLLACPTEDSVGCVWDAQVQGNGRGTTVINR